MGVSYHVISAAQNPLIGEGGQGWELQKSLPPFTHTLRHRYAIAKWKHKLGEVPLVAMAYRGDGDGYVRGSYS